MKELISEVYRVNSDGTIFSLHRNKNLIPRKNTNGYLAVHLYFRNGKRKSIDVHRLVAMFHCENSDPLNKIQVNHIDGNKLNNDVSNLEWVTPSENQRHMVAAGLMSIRKGSACPSSILNEEQVLEIREKLSAGIRNIVLEKEYGVSSTTISQIKNRKKWKHI